MSERKSKDLSPDITYTEYLEDKLACEKRMTRILGEFTDKYKLQLHELSVSMAPSFDDVLLLEHIDIIIQ